MFIKSWKKEIFTIPNLLSLFRLLLETGVDKYPVL